MNLETDIEDIWADFVKWLKLPGAKLLFIGSTGFISTVLVLLMTIGLSGIIAAVIELFFTVIVIFILIGTGASAIEGYYDYKHRTFEMDSE